MLTDKDKENFDYALVRVIVGKTKEKNFIGTRLAYCGFQSSLTFTIKQLLNYADLVVKEGISDNIEDVEVYIDTTTKKIQDGYPYDIK